MHFSSCIYCLNVQVIVAALEGVMNVAAFDELEVMVRVLALEVVWLVAALQEVLLVVALEAVVKSVALEAFVRTAAKEVETRFLVVQIVTMQTDLVVVAVPSQLQESAVSVAVLKVADLHQNRETLPLVFVVSLVGIYIPDVPVVVSSSARPVARNTAASLPQSYFSI